MNNIDKQTRIDGWASRQSHGGIAQQPFLWRSREQAGWSTAVHLVELREGEEIVSGDVRAYVADRIAQMDLWRDRYAQMALRADTAEKALAALKATHSPAPALDREQNLKQVANLRGEIEMWLFDYTDPQGTNYDLLSQAKSLLMRCNIVLDQAGSGEARSEQGVPRASGIEPVTDPTAAPMASPAPVRAAVGRKAMTREQISYSRLLKEAVCVFASLTPPDFADAIDETDASYAEWGPLLTRTAALRALAQLVARAEKVQAGQRVGQSSYPVERANIFDALATGFDPNKENNEDR